MKLKKWNWSGGGFIFLLVAIGLCSNKSVHNYTEWLYGTIIFGIPLTLIFAFISREE